MFAFVAGMHAHTAFVSIIMDWDDGGTILAIFIFLLLWYDYAVLYHFVISLLVTLHFCFIA